MHIAEKSSKKNLCFKPEVDEISMLFDPKISKIQ